MPEKQTILVVDDEKVIRGFCRVALEDAGFAVLEAEDGQQAKTILSSQSHIDLLITDVEMPNLSGPALVHDILPQTPGLRVLYITGSQRENRLLQRHVVEWGCGFLKKPFTPTTLIAEVRAQLTRPIPARAEGAPHRFCA